MNNSDIQAFSEIVRQGSFSKASKKLFITQSTLSSKIKNLEDELGCSLFYRKKGIRHIELTIYGKEFLVLVERWTKLWQEIENIKENTTYKSFNISALNSISSSILPQVFLSYLSENEKVFLKTDDLSSYASYDAVENRTIDFAIVVDRRYSLSVSCNELFSEKMVLISLNNSNLSKKVSVEELDFSKFVYCPWFLKFEQWIQSAFGKDFKPFIQIQIISQLIYMIVNNQCWSIVPNTIAQMLIKNYKIKIYDTKFKIPNREVFYLYYLDNINKKENSLVNSMIKHLKKELLRLEKEKILKCKI